MNPRVTKGWMDGAACRTGELVQDGSNFSVRAHCYTVRLTTHECTLGWCGTKSLHQIAGRILLQMWHAQPGVR